MSTMPSMGRKKEWPTAVERAVIAEVFLNGRQVREVVADLHAGQLEGIEAVPVPESTVYRWVDQARRNQPPTSRAPDLVDLEEMIATSWAQCLEADEQIKAEAEVVRRAPHDPRRAESLQRRRYLHQKELTQIFTLRDRLERARAKQQTEAESDPSTTEPKQPEREPTFTESLAGRERALKRVK